MDSIRIPHLAYNTSKTFNQSPTTLFLKKDEKVRFTLVNTTKAFHGLTLFLPSAESHYLKAGDSSSFEITFSETGVFRAADTSSAEARYMGLNMLLVVDDEKESYDHTYVWHLSDFDRELNHKVKNGETIVPRKYTPDYFTINGHIYPENMSDPLAVIKGKGRRQNPRNRLWKRSFGSFFTLSWLPCNRDVF